MRIKQFPAILILIYLLSINYVFSNNISADYIVCIVNDDIITQSELDASLRFVYLEMSKHLRGEELENEFNTYKDKALLKMIEDRLILQEAKDKNLKINEELIGKRIDEIKSEFPSQEEFNTFLLSQGLNAKDIKERFRNEFLMREIIDEEVKDKIIIHPKELTDFYQNNIEEFKVKEGLEVELISVGVDQKDKLIQDLEEKKDFDSLQEEYNQEGRSTIVYHGEFRQEIEDAIRNLEIDETTAPLEIDANIYLFRLKRKIPAYTKPFDKVSDSIYQRLFNTKMQERLVAWLEELKNKAYIIIK